MKIKLNESINKIKKILVNKFSAESANTKDGRDNSSKDSQKNHPENVIEENIKNKFTSFKLENYSFRKKKRQYILALILGGIICIVGLYMFAGDEDDTSQKGQTKTESGFLPYFQGTKLKNLETSKDNINPDELYKHKTEKESQKLRTEVQEIRGAIEQKLNRDSASPKVSSDEVLQLKKRIDLLESNQYQMGGKSLNNEVPQIPSISKINVRLSEKEQKKLQTVDNTIPAGSFAAGVLLSGLDASTSLSSSGNPTPMLIRLTDHGTLPRRFKSDLQDCHVIASGYGDISSERVVARLEKLTCVERLTGEILETAIAGYVSGEDGKAGLRGVVVSKDFKYLANSALGGIIGGFSNTISPKQSYAPFVASKEALSAPPLGERFQSGFAGGMLSSMDKLSQYYIDRAETLQPVIEVSAGRIIDIIFTQGVEVGSTTVKQELSLVRDESRKQAAKISAKNGE